MELVAGAVLFYAPQAFRAGCGCSWRVRCGADFDKSCVSANMFANRKANRHLLGAVGGNKSERTI